LTRGAVSSLLFALVVAVAAGTLYFLTAARDLVVGDSPDLITAAVILGVPHPPGYPLFTMLGHLFSLLPIGSLAFRVNLLSVTCDALTVGIVFLTAVRLSGSRLAATVAALILALNPLFWSWSLVAEVFSLNNFLASLVIYFLVVWHERPERMWALLLASFTTGLGFSNHHTIALLGPAIFFSVWRCRATLWKRPLTIPLALAVFLFGLLPYAYIPWAAARHPAWNWGNVASFSDLLKLVSRQQYGGLRLIGAAYSGGSVWLRIATLCFSFGAVTGSLALLGLIRAYRSCRWYFWFSLLAFGFTGLLFAIISDLNLESATSAAWVLQRFFLLPEVAVAPLVGFGVLLVADVIASSTPIAHGKRLIPVAGALGVVILVMLFTKYQQIDLSHNHIARNYGEDVLASLEPNSLLFVQGDPYLFPLAYLTSVEKVRPDVRLIATRLLAGRWYIEQLRAQYPDLNLPFDAYDGERNCFKALIEANRSRPIALIGPPPDGSAIRDYFPYPHGLVQLIEPNSKWIPIEAYAQDNEQLLKRYRMPKPADIRDQTFEHGILFHYSLAAWQVGTKFESVGSNTEAQVWYQRAREIDPGSEAIYHALLTDSAQFQGLYNGGL